MAKSSEKQDRVKAATHLADWEELAARELRGKAAEELTTTSADGVSIRPLYTAADLEGL